MNKTKIEWCGYTINPVKGLCPMACSYCYARAMYKRFKWNPEIRYNYFGWDNLPTKPSRIFVGSTIELFGEWIEPQWLTHIFKMVETNKMHTFIFLTKQPQNLIKWSPFPDNCWVGVTITDLLDREGKTPLRPMLDIEAKVKFISFEPLLNSGDGSRPDALAKAFQLAGINWVIIGAQSPYSKKTFPKWEWVREIIEACDKTSIPIFLKDNLRLLRLSCEGGIPFYKHHPSGTMELRQEFPVDTPNP